MLNNGLQSGALSTRQTGRRAGLAVLIVLAGLYVCFPLVNHSEAEDALHYAVNVRSGAPVYHANHLLFEPMHAAVFSAVQSVAGPQDALRVMQIVSTLSALVALGIVLRLVLRSGGGAYAAAVAVGATGLSAGFWVYALEADTYLPPLAWALGCIALLDRANARGWSPIWPVVGAAGAAGAATLLHQMYVFFALACGISILLAASGDRHCRLRAFLGFSVVSATMVGVCYLIAHLTLHTGETFFGWALGYAGNGLWDPPNATTLLKGLTGAATTVVTGNAVFATDPLAGWLHAAFPSQPFVEEIFLAENGIPKAAALLSLGTGLLAGGAMLFLGWESFGRHNRSHRSTFIDRLLAANILLFAALVMIWDPANREFWILIYVLVVLWVVRRVDWDTSRTRLAGAILVPALLVANFTGAIGLYSRPDLDYWRQINEPIIARAGEFDLVLTECGYICSGYIGYFGMTDAVQPTETPVESLRTTIQTTPAQRIAISSWLFSSDAAARISDVKRKQARAILAEAGWVLGDPPAPVPSAGQSLYRLEANRLVLVE